MYGCCPGRSICVASCDCCVSKAKNHGFLAETVVTRFAAFGGNFGGSDPAGRLLLAFGRGGSGGCSTFFGCLLLLLAGQSLLHADLGQAQRAATRSKAIFFLQAGDPFATSQDVAGAAAAETNFEGLIQRHRNTPINKKRKEPLFAVRMSQSLSARQWTWHGEFPAESAQNRTVDGICWFLNCLNRGFPAG